MSRPAAGSASSTRDTCVSVIETRSHLEAVGPALSADDDAGVIQTELLLS